MTDVPNELSAPDLDYRKILLKGLAKNNPTGRLSVKDLMGQAKGKKKKKGFFDSLLSAFTGDGSLGEGGSEDLGGASSNLPPTKTQDNRMSTIAELAQAEDDATARMLEDYRKSLNTPSFDFNPRQSYRFPGFFNG